MECPKVANAIFVFVEIVKSNHQLSSKVGSVLTKLLCSRLDDDEMFERCKGLQKEKNDLACRVKSIMMEKDELSKVVADLKARLSYRCTKKRLWSSKKRVFIRLLDRPSSSPRTLTWVFLALSCT